MKSSLASDNGGIQTVGNGEPIPIDTSGMALAYAPKLNQGNRNYTKPSRYYQRKCEKLPTLSRRHTGSILFLLLLILSLLMDADANMSDASTAGKRAASPMTKATRKKTTQDTSPTKQTRFTEPPAVEDVISTKANHNMATQGFEELNESMVTLARTPYERLHGHDMGDEKAFHDDLNSILLSAGKWIHGTTQLAQDQLKRIKEAPAIAPIITTANWTTLTRCIFRQETDKIKMLSSEECKQFKIIAGRLSHTKPSIIADVQRIIQSKIPGTNATRAWRGAVNILGSAYCCNDQPKQRKRTQKKPSETPKGKAPPIPPCFQATPAKERQDEAAATVVSPDNAINAYSKPKTKAKDAVQERTQSVRLMIALKLGKHETKTPNDLAFEQVKALFTHYQKNDPTTCILPWKLDNMDSLPAITKTSEIPTKMSEFKKTYAEGIRPKSNSTCWFKMRIAGSEDPVHFTSTNGSETQDFFTDTSHLAYLCTVQESDNTVDLCDFMYSGPYSNAADFEETLRRALHPRIYKFGCRLKKSKEIQEPKAVKDWLLKPNMVLHLEVDRAQAKALKNTLYHLFNTIDATKPRPGGYNFRVLPDKTQMRSGTRGARDRINMLRKHQANVQSLSVFKSYDIKHIDEVQKCNHGEYTLRQLLLEITSPIITTKTNPPKLFFTVDFAASGTDKDNGVVYLTAYNDRKELAAKVVDILPAFIEHMYGRDLAKKWCHASALGIIQDITFNTDDDGNDTGEWTTKEDDMGIEIINEDMGTKLDFSNLDLLTYDMDDRVLHNADDASAISFRSALGAEQTLIDDQMDAVVPGACQATVAPEQGAMSGEDSD
jgi:hypothetical protein